MRLRGVAAATAFLGLVAAGLVVAWSGSAAALTTFNVDNAGDGSATPANCTTPVVGQCRLVDAFAAASATVDDVEINIPASLGTITLTTGNAVSYTGLHALTLTGTGGNEAITQKSVTADRVIFDGAGAQLTIDHLTITGGHVANNLGGGIFASGDLAVTNSTISGNTASGGKSPLGSGGGIFSFGAVSVTNSTISGNTAFNLGGGISALFGAVAVTNSTISGNTSGGGGPGSAGTGGGIRAGGAVSVTNSTISGNTSGGGGSGIATTGGVTLVYATVVSNNSNVQLGGSANLSSFGSVLALAQGGGADCDLNGTTTTSHGFNFSDDASCGLTAPTDEQNGADPQLGPLANNGGVTLTRLPQPTSPLLDAIPTAHCSDDGASTITPLVDQIGLARPQGSGCEIGGKEVPVPAPVNASTPVVITPRFTG